MRERAAHTTSGPQAEAGGESRRALISSGVVRVTSESIGRGPQRARTYVSSDVVCVVLEGLLSKGEQRLVEVGATAAVLRLREAHFETMRADLTALVEDVCEQPVRACLSAATLEPDLVTVTFVLD